MKKLYAFIFMLYVVSVCSVTAQNLQPGYIDCGPTGTDFNLKSWAGTADDNFYISRVAPKARFSDKTTQVITDMVPWWTWKSNSKIPAEKYSRKLLMWMPLNFLVKGNSYGVLPNGNFNNEVFTMWQYVSHFGLWSSDFMRVPGNVVDVAHKNGVSVSTHFASSRNDDMSKWGPVINVFGKNTKKLETYLKKYGFDAIGYNSVWRNTSYNNIFVEVNKVISKLNKTRYASLKDPVTGMISYAAENIWYDGVTVKTGSKFDNGLNNDTKIFFGDAVNTVTSFFLNYNWNANYSEDTKTPGFAYLQTSVDNANALKRNPFDLYAGFNLQGKEPLLSSSQQNDSEDKRWTYLQKFPVSVGLWSGDDINTFWEARNACGLKDTQSQDTYQKAIERWFTNSRAGVSNPVYAADPAFKVNDSLDNDLETDFFGMSKFVEAQSTLCWNLSKEPFISCFNVGNGKFFNWAGITQHRKEWYNIGIQDYMPTWRWWWSSEKLGRTSESVTKGLTAEFSWNDAWLGGSSLRIKGTDTDGNPDYLHLFKTRFDIKMGDVITVRYKVYKGGTNMSLVLGYGSDAFGANCLKWEEDTPSDDGIYKLLEKDNIPHAVWVEKQIVIPATEKDPLAVIGLRFDGADNLDMNIGEISIKRGNYKIPEAPTIKKAEVLGFNMHGVDGKVIFDMTSNTNPGQYNINHNVSMFKIYVKFIYFDGTKTETLMGTTTSWAGIFFEASYDRKKLEEDATVQIGVSAVGLDGISESPIAWKIIGKLSYDNTVSNVNYAISDEIVISSELVTDGEEFVVRYADSRHKVADKWELYGPQANTTIGNVAAKTITFNKGLGFSAMADVNSENSVYTNMPAGFYDLIVTEGTKKRTFKAFVQIYNPSAGKPKIEKLVALDGDGASPLISEVSETAAKSIKFAEFENATFKWADERILPALVESHDALPGAGVKVYQNDYDEKSGTSRLRFYYEASSKSRGAVSNAASLDDKALGVFAKDLGLTNIKQPFTVAFWIKIKSINANSWILNIRDPEHDLYPQRARGWLWTGIDNKGNFTNTSIRGESESKYLYDGLKFEKNAWYHLAYTFDSTTETYNMYVNGQLENPSSVQKQPWISFKGTYTIGIGGIGGKGDYAGFDGMIDNFQVYNKALSADEVKTSMTEKGFINSSNLVGFWDFEKNSEGRTYDTTSGKEGYFNKVKNYPDARLAHHYYPTDPADEETQKRVYVNPVENVGYPAFSDGARDVKVSSEYEIIGCRSYEKLPVGTLDNSAEISGTPYIKQGEIEPVGERTYSMADGNNVTHNVSDNMGQFGYAEFTFPDPGPNCINVYTCKLVLDNGIGTDESLYRYVYVTRQKSAIVTSVEDIVSEEGNVKIFPNPVVENMYVAVDKGGNYTVKIFDMCGQTVAQTAVEAQAGECIIMNPEISAGLYAVQVICDGKIVKTQKMVKK